MNNLYTNDELRRIYDSVLLREKRRKELSNHRRNVAAIVDFASSVLKRKKPEEQNTGAKEPNRTLQRSNNSMKDYKGTIAGEMFRQRFASDRKM